MSSEWTALEQMFGPELCEQFMFMGRSAEIYLYKHIDTRRYLNVAPDGACFRYTPAGYVPVSRDDAITWVLS